MSTSAPPFFVRVWSAARGDVHLALDPPPHVDPLVGLEQPQQAGGRGVDADAAGEGRAEAELDLAQRVRHVALPLGDELALREEGVARKGGGGRAEEAGGGAGRVGGAGPDWLGQGGHEREGVGRKDPGAEERLGVADLGRGETRSQVLGRGGCVLRPIGGWGIVVDDEQCVDVALTDYFVVRRRLLGPVRLVLRVRQISVAALVRAPRSGPGEKMAEAGFDPREPCPFVRGFRCGGRVPRSHFGGLGSVRGLRKMASVVDLNPNGSPLPPHLFQPPASPFSPAAVSPAP